MRHELGLLKKPLLRKGGDSPQHRNWKTSIGKCVGSCKSPDGISRPDQRLKRPCPRLHGRCSERGSRTTLKDGSKQFSIFHSNWTLWKAYSFVVKDYCYLLIAYVKITFQIINSCTLADILVVMATWQALKLIDPSSRIQLHFTQKEVKKHFLRKL